MSTTVTETPSIAELIGDEIHRPHLIRPRRTEPLLTMHHSAPPPCGPLARPKTLFLVQPVHQILTTLPALAVQQHADLPVSVARSSLRYLSHPHAKFHPLLLATFVPVRCSPDLKNLADVPFAHPITCFQMLDQW